MKITAPTKKVFWIATVLSALGLVSKFVVDIPFVSANAFWFIVVGNVLLWLGVALKGF